MIKIKFINFKFNITHILNNTTKTLFVIFIYITGKPRGRHARVAFELTLRTWAVNLVFRMASSGDTLQIYKLPEWPLASDDHASSFNLLTR